MRTTALIIVILSVLVIAAHIASAEPPRVEVTLTARPELCTEPPRAHRYPQLSTFFARRVCYAAAIDLALRAIELASGTEMPRSLARERSPRCDVHCWFNRPTALIADAGLDPDSWPEPPPTPPGRWWLFFLASPDLGNHWTWVAVREQLSPDDRTQVMLWSER